MTFGASLVQASHGTEEKMEPQEDEGTGLDS